MYPKTFKQGEVLGVVLIAIFFTFLICLVTMPSIQIIDKTFTLKECAKIISDHINHQ